MKNESSQEKASKLLKDRFEEETCKRQEYFVPSPMAMD